MTIVDNIVVIAKEYNVRSVKELLAIPIMKHVSLKETQLAFIIYANDSFGNNKPEDIQTEIDLIFEMHGRKK